MDFWQILGNHDYYWNATAQIIYSNLMETNFAFPWFWYTLASEKNSNLSLKVIFIDTMIMMNDELTHTLPNYEKYDYINEQEKFLIAELAACSATYCLVGRYLQYSIRRIIFNLWACLCSET